MACRRGTASADPCLLAEKKDLVKIACDSLEGIPLWCLAIETEIVKGQQLLIERLKTLLPS